MQSRSWGYCTMLSPRMQPSAWVLKSRLGQLAGARAHQEASARARRELSFGRTRRGRAANETLLSKKELESCPPPYLTSEGQIKEKARKYAASAYLPLLFSPALGHFWLALSVTAAPCQLSRRESQVGSPPEACRKPSLASPFGGGGLALARTERARPPPRTRANGSHRRERSSPPRGAN